MDVQEVEVTIDKNGQVRIQVRGVKGETCLEITKDLENALGSVVDRQMTADALDPQAQKTDRTIHQKSG
jgi:hypothetical protein